ncbi:MAG: hypothetical protein R3338_02440 [Thermoanaerobaculia bacterium]|nr:hypothetical protein [Thermoanaerobaculia bacterium]
MRKSLVVGAIFLLATIGISAQNVDIEALSGLQFSFNNPGARAMGMGGAFLGLADDASAAEANPAGLTILRTPEVSIEGRNFEVIQNFNVTGEFPNIEREGFSSYSDPAELAFASFVYPMGRGVIAAYYHQPLKFEAEVNALTEEFLGIPQIRDLPVFFQPRGNPPGSAGPVGREECISIIEDTGDPFSCLALQLFPFVTSVQTKMKTAGLSFAYEFGNLSLGGSARYQSFETFASTFRVDADRLEVIQQVAQVTLDGDDFGEQDDWTFVGGFKWALSNNFSVGGSYKQGAEFPTSVFNDVGAGFELISDDVSFHVPDVYGIGFSWRPMPVLTLNADVVEVKYSNLTDDFQSIFSEARVLGQNAYETPDATEIHAGFEYFFTTSVPFAIRGGWWRDPAHGLEYTGPVTCHEEEAFAPSDRFACAFNRTTLSLLFPGGEDQDHWTIGVGLAWPNFQIDAAYDTSDTFKVGSISGVYRF